MLSPARRQAGKKAVLASALPLFFYRGLYRKPHKVSRLVAGVQIHKDLQRRQ